METTKKISKQEKTKHAEFRDLGGLLFKGLGGNRTLDDDRDVSISSTFGSPGYLLQVVINRTTCE